MTRRNDGRCPIGIREPVPTTEAPNFRDHGLMVDRWLLSLLTSLQKKHGEAFASERWLRWMIFQDSGHMPGVGTIPAAIARLELAGLVVQQLLAPGGIKPDGSPCTHGTRLLWVPQTRSHKSAARARARAKDRRERISGRPSAKVLHTLSSARQQRRTLIEQPTNRSADPSPEQLAQARGFGLEWTGRRLPTGALEWKPRRPPD